MFSRSQGLMHTQVCVARLAQRRHGGGETGGNEAGEVVGAERRGLMPGNGAATLSCR